MLVLAATDDTEEQKLSILFITLKEIQLENKISSCKIKNWYSLSMLKLKCYGKDILRFISPKTFMKMSFI